MPIGRYGLDIHQLVTVDVDQFYGIEIEEFPAQIAQVALWLTDHQMNLMVSEEFGAYFARIPLTHSASIVNGNALRIDWSDVLVPERCSYLLGNPPFVGKKEQNASKKTDMTNVMRDVPGAGVLDYVTAWYVKATHYMEANRSIRTAFVSTNSITQGEQVGALWSWLLARGVKIHFAHRTFAWSNEARGKAAVHCVIIGFGLNDVDLKTIYEYEDVKGEGHAVNVQNINPYLVDGPNIVIEKRTSPLCHVPLMDFGSKAADFGHLALSESERDILIGKYSNITKWIRPFLGSEEFINGGQRYCLWLKDIAPEELRNFPEILERIEKVRIERLKSVDANTRRWASFPALFQADRQPDTNYLVVPKVSSERRFYIPLGFMPPLYITNGSILVVPNATTYHYGVMQSVMHMAWTRAVCGRMKSDYQYSNTVVYNNFPWPAPNDKQRAAIEAAAQGVLDARANHPGASLADLYDPLTTPPDLVKAHQKLDAAVDTAYAFKGGNDATRVAFLFGLYQQLTSLLPQDKPKGRTRKTAETIESS